MNDKKIILSSQDIHDNIIVVAINLIQMEFPILAIQSPSLSFASGYTTLSEITNKFSPLINGLTLNKHK